MHFLNDLSPAAISPAAATPADVTSATIAIEALFIDRSVLVLPAPFSSSSWLQIPGFLDTNQALTAHAS